MVWQGRDRSRGKRNAKRKGQYEIVEVVILFSIGILVLGGLIFLFSSMSTSITEPLLEQELNEVANVILARVVDLARLNQSGAEFRLSIPETAANAPYSIIASGRQLLLSPTEASGVGVGFVGAAARRGTPLVSGLALVNKTSPVILAGSALSTQKNLQLRFSYTEAGEPQVEIGGIIVY